MRYLIFLVCMLASCGPPDLSGDPCARLAASCPSDPHRQDCLDAVAVNDAYACAGYMPAVRPDFTSEPEVQTY